LPLHEKPILLDEYYGDGYGVGAAWGEAAKERFAREGYALEQTYSAKAAACFLDQVDASDLPVLFWHTFNSRPVPTPAPMASTVS